MPRGKQVRANARTIHSEERYLGLDIVLARSYTVSTTEKGPLTSLTSSIPCLLDPKAGVHLSRMTITLRAMN